MALCGALSTLSCVACVCVYVLSKCIWYEAHIELARYLISYCSEGTKIVLLRVKLMLYCCCTRVEQFISNLAEVSRMKILVKRGLNACSVICTRIRIPDLGAKDIINYFLAIKFRVTSLKIYIVSTQCVFATPNSPR